MGGALDSRFTFTRSTTATYINSSGYVATMAAAATNDPTKARFDYDPTTLAPKGLLIEGSATNLQRYSATFQTTGSYWYSTAGSMTNGILGDAPDVGTSQLFMEPTSGTGAGLWQLNGTSAGLVASTTYTVSFWARTGFRNKVMWRCDGGGKDVGFNLDTGVATVVAGTFTNTKMTAYSRGWYRCEATWANVNAGGYPGLFTATGTGTTYTTSYSCDGSYVELWGFQLEVGTGASSYIPTVASQVTRSADSCNIGTIAPFNYSTTNGTLFYSGIITKQNSASYPARIGFHKAAPSVDIRVFSVLTNTSDMIFTVNGTGGEPQKNLAYSLNTAFKAAWSFDVALSTNKLIANINGVTGTSGSTALSVTNDPTQFTFGQSGYETYFPCGTIAAVKYWNTTKTAAELAALTA